MCGIVGLFQTEHSLQPDLEKMARALSHRGPDDWGIWVDERSPLGLAHRRLSILDLSPEGHQPMRSAQGRYVISYNGEVYNFQEIRAALQERGPQFRGGSDTEVLLAAFEEWGVTQSIEKCNGMFAAAVWDCSERTLWLFRDRMGIKPLYYGWNQGAFFVASELKALRAHPRFSEEINRDSLAALMRFCYVPSPYSIFAGIYTLPPGTYLRISEAALRQAQPIEPSVLTESSALQPTRYWDLAAVVAAGKQDPFEGSDEEAADALDAHLREAVALRMISDVPLGAFLSGGIDSSLVVSLMQAQSDTPVRTFSIGFREQEFDEAGYARAVAQHLGTDHTELYVTARDALNVIPKIPELYDEPFADSSQIPTYLVSQLAREHVTVSLSGDGGDELFCGYPRYVWGARVWSAMRWVPRHLRAAIARMITVLSPLRWEQLFRASAPLLPESARLHHPGDKLHKLARVLNVASDQELYMLLISHWDSPADLVRGAVDRPTIQSMREKWPQGIDFLERVMFLDMAAYIPDDLLVKTDRASMAVSLESRVPLLDYRLVEFAWRLPLRFKYRDGVRKWLLRNVLYRYVPPALVDRPKMGFGVPVGQWLRGELREWAEDLLSERRLEAEGYFDPSMVRKKWAEHLAGLHNWQYYLWDVLMFQAWLRNHE